MVPIVTPNERIYFFIMLPPFTKRPLLTEQPFNLFILLQALLFLEQPSLIQQTEKS